MWSSEYLQATVVDYSAFNCIEKYWFLQMNAPSRIYGQFRNMEAGTYRESLKIIRKLKGGG